MEKQLPIYQQIANDIEKQIKSNNFEYDSTICTEKTLSEKYNVSRITAKHAITSLEERGILYRIRGIGSFVAKNTLGQTYALVIPRKNANEGGMQVMEMASQVFFDRGHHFTIHLCRPGMAESVKLLENLFNHHISGIAYYYPPEADLPVEILNAFVQKKKPVIILDKKVSYPEFSSIICDNYRGSYLLTEHLISYGHTQMCYLSRNEYTNYSSTLDRYNGFKDCLKDSGINTEPRSVCYFTEKEKIPFYNIKHLVKTLHREGITAILCDNDISAFSVYFCCQILGIRVPEDISITGFDNIEWATACNAQITTIDQNFNLIGSTLAETLLDPDYKPGNHTIPVQLIPRASTGEVRR